MASNPGSDDPTDVEVVAVSAPDVVSAFEANRQRGAGVVLRVTPPFSARMRARLHAGDREYDGGPSPIHVDPAALLAAEVVEAYPTPDATEDRLRAEPDRTYDRETHREYHERRLSEWRRRAVGAIVDAVTVATPAGDHTVEVAALGDADDL